MVMRPPLAALLLVLSACAGFDPLTAEQRGRLGVFDCYWQAIADDYPLFGRRAIDWDEIREQYRAAVPQARSRLEFYRLLAGMLAELDDLHISLSVPLDELAEDGVAPTSLLDVAGFRVMPVGGRPHVVGWPDGTAPVPPDGLDPRARYPEIVRVEGHRLVLSLAQPLALGRPDSPVELVLRWRDGTLSRHVMHRPPAGTAVRRSAFGHLDRDGQIVWRHPGERYPRLELATFHAGVALAAIDDALTALDRGDGLVVDLRRNQGGSYGLTHEVTGRFLAEPVRHVVPSESSMVLGLIPVELFGYHDWVPRAPRVRSPVVVLTSVLTGSAAEHFARVLQRHAGAVVVGEQTAGAEAMVGVVPGGDGSELRFSYVRLLDAHGRGFDGEGVAPDRAVPLRLDDVERLGPDGAVADWNRRVLAAAHDVLDAVGGR